MKYNPNTGKSEPVLDAQGRQTYNTPYSMDRNGNYKFNNVNGFDAQFNNNKADVSTKVLQELMKKLESGTLSREESLGYNSLLNFLRSKNSEVRKYGGYLKRK